MTIADTQNAAYSTSCNRRRRWSMMFKLHKYINPIHTLRFWTHFHSSITCSFPCFLHGKRRPWLDRFVKKSHPHEANMQSKTLATIIALSATVLGHPAAGNAGPHPNAGGAASYPIPPDFEPNRCYCCPTTASVISSGLCAEVDFETKATTCAIGDNLICCDDGLVSKSIVYDRYRRELTTFSVQ